MADEWISRCGIRFWGEGQFDGAVWTMTAFLALYVILAALGVLGSLWTIREGARDRSIVEMLLGAAMLAFTGVMLGVGSEIFPLTACMWQEAW